LRDLCEKERPMRLLFSVSFDRDSFVGSWHLAVNLRVVRPVAMKNIFRAREANSEGRLVGVALKRASLSAKRVSTFVCTRQP
jgi:hypothetical protein